MCFWNWTAICIKLLAMFFEVEIHLVLFIFCFCFRQSSLSAVRGWSFLLFLPCIINFFIISTISTFLFPFLWLLRNHLYNLNIIRNNWNSNESIWLTPISFGTSYNYNILYNFRTILVFSWRRWFFLFCLKNVFFRARPSRSYWDWHTFSLSAFIL